MDDDRGDDRHADPVRAHAHAGEDGKDLHIQEDLHDEHIRRAEQTQHQQNQQEHAPGKRLSAHARVLIAEKIHLAVAHLNLRQLDFQILKAFHLHTAGTAV